MLKVNIAGKKKCLHSSQMSSPEVKRQEKPSICRLLKAFSVTKECPTYYPPHTRGGEQ